MARPTSHRLSSRAVAFHRPHTAGRTRRALMRRTLPFGSSLSTSASVSFCSALCPSTFNMFSRRASCSLPFDIQHVRAALIASRRSSRVGFAVAPKYNNLQEARKSHPLTCFHCRRVHLRQTNGDSWVFQRPRLHRPQREGPVLPLHALLSRPHYRCSSTLAPPLPDPARQQVLRSERRLVPLPAGNQPQIQYASCEFQNTSLRGAFGDALAEVDWIVGNV